MWITGWSRPSVIWKDGGKDTFPCHCVSLKAKIKMAETLNVSEVGVGMEIMAQDRMC